MGYRKVLENLSREPWKVLELFVSKRVGTLFLVMSLVLVSRVCVCVCFCRWLDLCRWVSLFYYCVIMLCFLRFMDTKINIYLLSIFLKLLYCLSNARHSIGQSIKSPECSCVRASVGPTFLKLSSFHLPFPFSFPFPFLFLSLLLPLPFSLPFLSPFLFLFPFFCLSFRVHVYASNIWGIISP